MPSDGSTPGLRSREKRIAVVHTSDTQCVVRIPCFSPSLPGDQLQENQDNDIVPPTPETYQFFDQSYLSFLAETTKWPAYNGVVELIPIIVGVVNR